MIENTRMLCINNGIHFDVPGGKHGGKDFQVLLKVEPKELQKHIVADEDL